MGIGSAQVDNAAFEARLEIKLPRGGKQAAGWGGFDAQSGTLSVGGNVSSGLGLQGAKGFEMKALPYLSLPASIETFDSGLETGFSWGSKDRGDAQAQTQTNHPSQSVTKLVSALETSVVIELGIGWQAKDFPVLDHGLDRRTGKDGAIWPRSNQTSVQRYRVEDFNVDSTLDDQAFDNIEAIEFTAPLGHLRQIPTGWRRWMTSSMLTIQSPAPRQDAPNGSYGRKLRPTSGNQVSLDCLSPIFTQDASVLEFSAYSNNQVLNASLGALDTMRPVRAILPVDSAQPFPLSSLSPVMNCGDANMKSTSHLSQRFTLTHCFYHRFAPLKRRTF
jgi:hypothetical protein